MLERSPDPPIEIPWTRENFPLGFMNIGDRFIVDVKKLPTLYRVLRIIHKETLRHYVVFTSRAGEKICMRAE